VTTLIDKVPPRLTRVENGAATVLFEDPLANRIDAGKNFIRRGTGWGHNHDRLVVPSNRDALAMFDAFLKI
jgi:hypothetical protein